MPRKTIYQAVTERLEILDPEGRVDEKLMPELSEDQVRGVYGEMVRMRAFDDKAIKLQRQGRMGTWPPIRGQEAAQAGVGLAMAEEDWFIPAFRDHGLGLMRGIPGHLLYAAWAGDERGASFPEGVRAFPMAVPVGSQFTHGAGVGLSLKLRGEEAAAVTLGGDGATSQGDFHEALNFAGVFKCRTVFVIQNNQWAISVPFSQQTAAGSIAQKAHAYGIPGLQVDGNDVFAMYVATTEALERARSGEGPTLIEAVTYRIGDHTTADEASRYRGDEEVEEWRARDPIDRLRRYMDRKGMWDEARQEALESEVKMWVNRQVEALEGMAPVGPEEIFRSMYAEMPLNLREQMEGLMQEVGS